MAEVEEAFMEAVEEGLNLSKRLYFGKDRSVAPPKPPPSMSKNPSFYLPTAPMVYAVITDPGIVDNPDIPSYQPYVYGRCDPPALIPLQMNSVSMEVDCYLDTVFVRVSGQWRVHCVMGSKVCDCRLAVPMGEQGSILGVEIDVPKKSYHTQLVSREDEKDEKASGGDDGGFLRPDIFFLTIPQVDGGSNLNITISWSQKLLYHDGEFSLSIPFCFPEYVNPASKKIPRREKMQLNVHPGDGSEVLCKTISHPLKERKRQVDSLSFKYESDVLSWSNTDFSFSYSVPTSRISGSVLLQSPSIEDTDQREMFCVHLLPGTQQGKKFFARNIIYVVDISSSMQGRPLEATKKSLGAALSELTPEDMFNIIAFNATTFPFSSSMMHANQETIERAIQWMDDTLLVGDGTKISLALDKAMEMLSDTQKSLPLIFLITDGAVEDERRICKVAKSRLSNTKAISPRIHTFGIGIYCNHFFLRMLAMIGQGHYEAAYNADLIESRLQKLITTASSTVFTNITFDTLDELDNAEVHPINVPDLSSQSPLTISGRYSGKFPEVFKARGIIADMSRYELDLKVYKVQTDVIQSLCLQNPLVLKSSFNRPNIHYEVRYKDLLDDSYADLCGVMKSCGDICGIIYCLERSACDALAIHLSSNAISCAAYHAGLNNTLRCSVLDDWISSKIQVVVATVAFGMGIDRKDVRIVCHFNIPKSMEAFYQESGRAGRDQLPCRSVLYYSIDDRKRMEFILKNPQNKKSKSSSLEDASSKKSLDDFRQMVEYCEGSDCRRKKILQSFGEQAPASLCRKTCDACKQPNLVAKHLEQLSSSAALQKNLLARVVINSSSNNVDGERYSEFWNRSDDKSCDSEEDISDSDEEGEALKSLSYSGLPSRSRLSEKLDILQRAEEKYYQNQGSQKETSRKYKNLISDTLRESCKQRLANALKENQQLGSVDIESAVTILENECYKKCEKGGKTFYLSQMASTARWLSTASINDLTNKLQSNTSNTDNLKKKEVSILEPTSSSNNSIKPMKEIIYEKTRIDPSATAQTSESIAQKIVLPPVPSFSDFVRSNKAKDGQAAQHSNSKRNSADVSGTADKRMRSQ